MRRRTLVVGFIAIREGVHRPPSDELGDRMLRKLVTAGIHGIRGRRRGLSAVAGVVLAGVGGAAAPAVAASAPLVSFTDPCGDAQRVLRVPPYTVDVGTGRTARHDIKSTGFAPLAGGGVAGLRVTLELCGPIPAAEQIGSTWSVRATLPDGCEVSITLRDARSATGPTRTARYVKTCIREVNGGPLPLFVEDVPFSHVLSGHQVAVSGSTITWLLRADAFGGVAASTLTGTEWSELRSWTLDEARITDVEHRSTGVAAAGPGVRDNSEGTGTLSVG